MTSDFILQLQSTMYRRQSPAFSTLYTEKIFTAAQLGEHASLAARLQYENRKLGITSRRQHVTFGGYG